MDLRCESPVEWKVEKCLTDDLQAVLNHFVDLGFEVERYEKISEQYDGFMWIIIGWKPRV